MDSSPEGQFSEQTFPRIAFFLFVLNLYLPLVKPAEINDFEQKNI